MACLPSSCCHAKPRRCACGSNRSTRGQRIHDTDSGRAGEGSGSALSSALEPGLTGTYEHRMDDANEGAIGIIFADSPENTCPTSHVTCTDQPGLDRGHDAPILSMMPQIAGSITPLQNQNGWPPRQQMKRRCNAEDLRNKMIKVCASECPHSRYMTY